MKFLTRLDFRFTPSYESFSTFTPSGKKSLLDSIWLDTIKDEVFVKHTTSESDTIYSLGNFNSRYTWVYSLLYRLCLSETEYHSLPDSCKEICFYSKSLDAYKIRADFYNTELVKQLLYSLKGEDNCTHLLNDKWFAVYDLPISYQVAQIPCKVKVQNYK